MQILNSTNNNQGDKQEELWVDHETIGYGGICFFSGVYHMDFPVVDVSGTVPLGIYGIYTGRIRISDLQCP